LGAGAISTRRSGAYTASGKLAPRKTANVEWKGIVLNTTKLSYIQKHFEARPDGKYAVPGQQAVFTVGLVDSTEPDPLVRQLSIEPGVRMTDDDVLAAYGKDFKERRDDDFVRRWTYDDGREAVFGQQDDEVVSLVLLRDAQGVTGGSQPRNRVTTRGVSEVPHPLLLKYLSKDVSVNWAGLDEE
jgi:hypothetical protein